MFFENNDISSDMDFAFLNLSGLTKDNISPNEFLNAKEGFLRGNMFKNEYKPYKNMTYIQVKPSNEREAKLYNVMCYSFAINDMNLYLDTHPEDRSALKYLEELIEEEKKVKEEYINLYGPLDICDTKGNTFKWVDSPWPWENLGGNIYV